MNARSFLVSLCKMRKWTLDHRCAKKNILLLNQYHRDIMQWMEFNKPNDAQCAQFIKRWKHKVEYLLPGGDSKVAATWKQKLEAVYGEC